MSITINNTKKAFEQALYEASAYIDGDDVVTVDERGLLHVNATVHYDLFIALVVEGLNNERS